MNRCQKSLVLAAVGVFASAIGWTITPHSLEADTTTSKIKTVIEMYTSQGCSSCPPADRLLKTYVDRPDVIALTMAVDYWDYLGWKDTFASPRNSARQRAYAVTRGDGAVYTPQAVINGRTHAVGSRPGEMERAIKGAAGLENIPVQFKRTKKNVTITIGAAKKAAAEQEATVWLAVVQGEGKVAVKRGENRGEALTYYNVVRSMSAVGMWNGETKSFTISRDAMMPGKAEACAILVQQGTTGPILGAAWMPL